MGQMTIFLTFAPTADDSIPTSLLKEIRLALRSHKVSFYQGELFLSATSSILVMPTCIVHIALLTLLYMDQENQVPSPIERPRQVSDVIANVTPQGHAP
jgi:hypothetical protein